jgi:hypothetical protein
MQSDSENPLIPRTIGELMDKLGWMMLSSPTFRLDFAPSVNIDTVFHELNEGLKLLRKNLGEERYELLTSLADQMKPLFKADPEDKTGAANEGRKLILEMEEIVKGRTRKSGH